jgi:hypothetical protein
VQQSPTPKMTKPLNRNKINYKEQSARIIQNHEKRMEQKALPAGPAKSCATVPETTKIYKSVIKKGGKEEVEKIYGTNVGVQEIKVKKRS